MSEYGDIGGAICCLIVIALVLAWAHWPRRHKRTEDQPYRPFDRERD